MKKKHSRWFKWQRGQALMEYWPTIPAAICLMLAASGLTQAINKSILTTVDYLNPTGLECPEQEEKDEGPDEAQLNCHTIQLVGRSYDEVNDRTTVAYKVTNGCDPDISHWMLGAPSWIQDKILSASEKWEWVVDPTTGVAGIKFDTEYGGGGGKGKKAFNQEEGFQGATVARDTGIVLMSSTAPSELSGRNAETEPDSRTVLVTLAGHYNWTMTTVAIKASTEVYHSTITAPIEIYQGDEDECEM
jgi:hypothetical protein